MTVLNKKQMSEEDIKLNFITSAIQPGWSGHITMETKITDGRIIIKGNMVARSKPKYADYLLYLKRMKRFLQKRLMKQSLSGRHFGGTICTYIYNFTVLGANTIKNY